MEAVFRPLPVCDSTTCLRETKVIGFQGLTSRFWGPAFCRLRASTRKKCLRRAAGRSSTRAEAVLAGNLKGIEKETFKDIETGSPKITHLYRLPLLSDSATQLLKRVQMKICSEIVEIKTEQCFNAGLSSPLSNEKLAILKWLLGETYEPEKLQAQSLLEMEMPRTGSNILVEVGPRLSFMTAWSANAVSICKACTLTEVTRIERSKWYLLCLKTNSIVLQQSQLDDFVAMVHDKMTECLYPSKLLSFKTNVVPVLEQGKEALEEINKQIGLAFDEFDLEYYTRLFRDDIKRNPTNVELFDLAQSNSEHSRHWFFQGDLVIDGQLAASNLMRIVKDTLKANPNNSVIGFNDNSSAIRGFPVQALLPVSAGSTSLLSTVHCDFDILFTAETHNFPCATFQNPYIWA